MLGIAYALYLFHMKVIHEHGTPANLLYLNLNTEKYNYKSNYSFTKSFRKEIFHFLIIKVNFMTHLCSYIYKFSLTE